GNGHKIGFPTANLEMSLPYLLPKSGVYLGLFYLRGVPHKAIINVGKNPTVGLLKHPVVESYIKDVDEDLYGEYVYIAFLRRIRDEIKFNSLEELKAQLENDKKELLK
ncbi:MAG: riboflavin kinase, partial [Bacilli bacterium]|nr:riboflavin kinase [Bacilli bacterium]